MRLFTAADSVLKGGGVLVRQLMIQFFKKTTSIGGFEDFTPDSVVKTVILPQYKATDSLSDSLNRVTCAASLAFLYLTQVKKTYREANDGAFITDIGILSKRMKNLGGMSIPTLTAQPKNKGLVSWETLSITRAQKYSLDEDGSPENSEIHLGVEMPSATNALVEFVNTALGQMKWTIVDPLAAAFIFNDARAVSLLQQSDPHSKDGFFSLRHSDALSAFQGQARSNSDMYMWGAFLQGVGVVDLFGVYRISGELRAPSLFQLLGRLLSTAEATDSRDQSGWKWTEDESKHDADAVAPCGSEVSVYQPNTSLQAPLRVTQYAHSALARLAQMTISHVEHLFSTATKLMTTKVRFLEDLKHRAWIPVHLLPSLDEPRDSFVVAAPGNVFCFTQGAGSRDPHQVYPLGAHAMYSTVEMTLFAHQAGKYLGLLHSHNAIVDLEYILGQFLWMCSRPEGSTVVASLSSMRDTYSHMFEFMQQSSDHPHAQTIRSLLEEDRPFLWFPDTVTLDESGLTDQHVIAQGKMFRLSSVFAVDPTKVFSLVSDKMKELARFYPNLGEMFSRKRCCPVCQAVEGMFGASGQKIGVRFGELACTCTDKSFGQFVPEAGGLVRTGPAMKDSLVLLRRYQEEILSVDDPGGDDYSLIPSVREEQKTVLMGVVRGTLDAISREVWKCFHIPNSLHAYAPDALRLLKDTFTSERLLPVMDGHEFVSGVDSALHSIVVDDSAVIDAFASLLKAVSDVSWIDGKVTHSDFFKRLPGADGTTPNEVYDIDSFEIEKQRFLSLSAKEFYLAVNSISPTTFYAPNNMLALLDLLGLRKLSEFVRQDVQFEVTPTRGDKSGVFAMLNNILSVAQRFLMHKGQHNLSGTPSFLKIAALVVKDCKHITRHLKLDFQGIEAETDCEEMFHYDMTENVLYVDASVDKPEKIKFCVDLVMSAIRIEVAVLNKNTLNSIMDDLAKLLTKWAGQPSEQIQLFLHVEFENVTIPQGTTVWQLKVEEVAADVPEPQVDQRTSEAMEGATRMALEASQPRNNKTAKPKPVEAMTVEHLAYLANKARSDTETAQLTLAKAENKTVEVNPDEILPPKEKDEGSVHSDIKRQSNTPKVSTNIESTLPSPPPLPSMESVKLQNETPKVSSAEDNSPPVHERPPQEGLKYERGPGGEVNNVTAHPGSRFDGGFSGGG
eukprot:gene34636-42724_t